LGKGWRCGIVGAAEGGKGGGWRCRYEYLREGFGSSAVRFYDFGVCLGCKSVDLFEVVEVSEWPLQKMGSERGLIAWKYERFNVIAVL